MHNSDESSVIREVLTAGYLQTAKDVSNTNINIQFSGTTLVGCLMLNTKLFCANLGDSRAVIAKQKNGDFIPCPLSKDHKPDDNVEMERILSHGGRVETYRDIYGNQVGPYRVWLKHENIPGLAMARSIGDLVAASVGVIAEPEIFEFDLKEEDKFMVIASDGVWEFLSNRQVINMIVPYYQKNQLELACEKVIKEATLRWKKEDEVIDDITCVIVGLNIPPKTA
mmetsp:Transcript_20353/g.17652  ORF Transcript_20353/g.17652 Transcript_20353/m.17652 type:complete len:225 (+) Transcript_20353:1403-2077(+)|eukprot:CAMPEP_0114579614 /NCGR_PEP_ID=MMETSP0125-20121206/3953_1 /TAXON_ID=485358 ORGANISM="Aristerostoma sp., Strain ATCC 50986" /NCGR_SAMPLE_ID=MMETSP0125 /ASSEMBLY_ACC=CAM_ASM_000245 /LENGTH=224 /DNA_ID=CAMNT_0001770459 /DNA_START=1330 /DNA_END=2004 /DNA_ORIENTATION=+